VIKASGVRRVWGICTHCDYISSMAHTLDDRRRLFGAPRATAVRRLQPLGGMVEDAL
jgi:hypothetical protein